MANNNQNKGVCRKQIHPQTWFVWLNRFGGGGGGGGGGKGGGGFGPRPFFPFLGPPPPPASYGSGMWQSIPVCERGVIFLMEGIWKGYPFCQKWYIKGKQLDLWSEPPCIKLCWLPPWDCYCTFVSLVSFLSFLKGTILKSTLPVIPS